MCFIRPSLPPSLMQAQEEYERRLKEEMAAKTMKEKEIEQLVSAYAYACLCCAVLCCAVLCCAVLWRRCLGLLPFFSLPSDKLAVAAASICALAGTTGVGPH